MLKYTQGGSDALGALHALAEGDATSAMLDQVSLAQGASEPTAVRISLAQGDKHPEEMLALAARAKKGRISNSPRLLSLSLLAPYANGLRFVSALRKKDGWAAVERAWKKPPRSTEQVLHIDKYEKDEAPLSVPSPPARKLGADWKKTF